MATKYLVEFLAKWIRDPDFRCKVMHKELDTLRDDEGYSVEQVTALVELDKWKLICLLIEELESLGIDLDAARKQIYGRDPSPADCCGHSGSAPPPPEPLPPGLAPPAWSFQPFERTADATPSRTTPEPAPQFAGLAGFEEPRIRRLVALSTAAVYGQGEVHLRTATPSAFEAGKKRKIMLEAQGVDPDDELEVEFTMGPESETGDVKNVTCDIDLYQRIEVEVELDDAGVWEVKAKNKTDSDWGSDTVKVTAI